MPTKVNHKDIQAIFRGFDRRWPLGRFYYLRYESSSAGHKLLQWLRDKCGGALTSYRDLDEYPEVCVNAAFTYWGLSVLGLTPEVLQSFPGDFRQGMARRSKLLGDVGDSAPENWEELWRDDKAIHLWVGVYARSEDALARWDGDLHSALEELAERYAHDDIHFVSVDQPDVRFSSFMMDIHRSDLDPTGQHSDKPPVSLLGSQDVKRFWFDPAKPMHIDDPSTNPERPVVMEHFGFQDGVSQPVIEGLEENRQKERNEVAGGGKITPHKGEWQPLATGEFLLGYLDEMGEIPLAPVPPTLAFNGSFMVQRKLAQDVDGFRAYLEGVATGLESRDGEPVSADYLAEKMMGRRRNGRPFADTDSLNDFRYDDDLDGRKCPLGAHMRRANPRDAMVQEKKVAKQFGSLLANRHRILRRAITYGEPVPHGKSMHDVNDDGQGLMFITLQASIAGQYEFVQQQWLNFGNDLNQGNDRDPVVGNQEGQGRFTIPGDGNHPTMICDQLPRFVETRGGQYFFLPGVSAFNLLAGERYTQVNSEE